MKPAAMRLKAQPQAVQAQQAPAFLIVQRAHQQAALQPPDHRHQVLDLRALLFQALHYQAQQARNFIQALIAAPVMVQLGKEPLLVTH